MKATQIPDFLSGVLIQIQAGIDLFNRSNPKALATYPKEVDIQLSVYDQNDEYHQFWAKISFESHIDPSLLPEPPDDTDGIIGKGF